MMRQALRWPLLVMLSLPAFLAAEDALDSRDSTLDAWYPRMLSGERGTITLHAPQIESWDGFQVLKAYMAFQVELKGTGRKPYGTISFSAKTDVDLTNREVLLYNFEIKELSIPEIQSYELEYSVLREALENYASKVPLDLVLAYLPKDMPVASARDLSTDPPPIFFSTSPAVLLLIDTQPIFLPAGEDGMEFVLNANWSLFREKGQETCYLLGPDGWLTGETLQGPWIRSTRLPEAFRELPDDPSWQLAIDALPEDLSGFMVIQSMPPKVILSMVPAELIVFRGEPVWEPVAETGISMAANSEAEVYKCGESFYFLSAGRWFSTTNFDGDWVPQNSLPDAFQAIPKDHPRAYIRSSIPGTPEAWEAAIVASIPVSASFDRADASRLAPEVIHSGEPVFVPIEGTSIELALSTSFQVLRYEETYYLCYNATWFTSSNPEGPWSFADSLPDEFAKIPASSPAHNTTYVQVEESTDDSITYSSTAGYTNSYVSDSGTVVNGSGYVQSTVVVWVGYGSGFYYPMYPYYRYPYYPWPPTYGYGAWYNPETGRYGESLVAYGPFGAARSTAVYNPTTGVYGRGQAVWDSDEMAGRRYAYNPNTDTSLSRRGYYDFGENEGWSQRVTRRGDEWIASETRLENGLLTTSRGAEGTVNRELEDGQLTGSGSFNRDGKTIESDTTRNAEGVRREFDSSDGGQMISGRQGENRGFVGETASGDVYAGRNGQAYKKTDSGWESVSTGRSASMANDGPLKERPSRQYNSSTYRQLDRDWQSRQQGYQRYESFQRSRTGAAVGTGGRLSGRRR